MMMINYSILLLLVGYLKFIWRQLIDWQKVECWMIGQKQYVNSRNLSSAVCECAKIREPTAIEKLASIFTTQSTKVRKPLVKLRWFEPSKRNITDCIIRAFTRNRCCVHLQRSNQTTYNPENLLNRIISNKQIF